MMVNVNHLPSCLVKVANFLIFKRKILVQQAGTIRVLKNRELQGLPIIHLILNPHSFAQTISENPMSIFSWKIVLRILTVSTGILETPLANDPLS